MADIYMPPRYAKEDKRLGWLKEAKEEGESFLREQTAYGDIDRAIRMVFGPDEKLPSKRSKLRVNMFKRDLRENVAVLANIRPLWGYKTDNDSMMHQAEVLNKMLFAWYLNTFADRKIRKGLQWAGATGLGWLSPVWRADFWVAGRGDIDLRVYGPDAVLPVQIGPDGDLQDAYAVTIVTEVPLAKALSIYPTMADKIAPDRARARWMRKGRRRLERFQSPVLRAFGPGGKGRDESESYPTVDIHYTYLLDLAINETGSDVEMGAPGTRWNYTVPSYGSEIPTGRTNGGNPVTRPASFEESRIYPLRRLVIWTSRGVLYDDTSTFWHGKVPLVKLALDDWPWDFLGYSMARDAGPIQDSTTRLLRAIDDSANTRLSPPIGYDKETISRALMERLDLRVPEQAVALNMQMSDGVKPILPPQFYDVPAYIQAMVEKLFETMHYVLGTRDLTAIAKARQVPAGDSLEKYMELAGPIVTDMSRSMEYSMRDLGEMWKALAFEFYDLPRRVQILGPDGATEQDWDFNPNDMIPSHLPDEMELIRTGQMDSGRASRANVVERARAHQNSFYFHVTPNSMHQVTQLTRKMMALQLWRSGFPIDPWTVAQQLDLQNFGAAPKDSDKTIFGNWIQWKKVLAEIARAEAGGVPAPRGRKPTGQVPPTMQSKSGGTRSIVRESPR